MVDPASSHTVRAPDEVHESQRVEGFPLAILELNYLRELDDQ